MVRKEGGGRGEGREEERGRGREGGGRGGRCGRDDWHSVTLRLRMFSYATGGVRGLGRKMEVGLGKRSF